MITDFYEFVLLKVKKIMVWTIMFSLHKRKEKYIKIIGDLF